MKIFLITYIQHLISKYFTIMRWLLCIILNCCYYYRKRHPPTLNDKTYTNCNRSTLGKLQHKFMLNYDVEHTCTWKNKIKCKRLQNAFHPTLVSKQ